MDKRNIKTKQMKAFTKFERYAPNGQVTDEFFNNH